MNILLIKLGALGDVLRTTPLLTALRARHPSARITWLVDAAHREILDSNPLIDRLWTTGETERLEKERFDLAINLEKETEALEAMDCAVAGVKKGFVTGPGGAPAPADAMSEYAWRLGVDDDLKFRTNRLTYQEISFGQVGLSFSGEEYVLVLSENDLDYAKKALATRGFRASAARPVVGLNTGSGQRFAGKRLPAPTWEKLARLFAERMGATVFLLGGPDEKEKNRELAAALGNAALDTGSHSIRHFAAIVRQCDLVISGDTTAMHVAIAVKVPVVAYFASTCAQEIELYGRGAKVVSGIPCAPCYKRVCPIDEQCMKDLSAETLFEAAAGILDNNDGMKPKIRISNE